MGLRVRALGFCAICYSESRRVDLGYCGAGPGLSLRQNPIVTHKATTEKTERATSALVKPQHIESYTLLDSTHKTWTRRTINAITLVKLEQGLGV